MKVRILRNLGRGLPDYLEGQEVDVTEELGRQLLEMHLAVERDPGIKAVPPDGSVDKATEDVTKLRDKATGRKHGPTSESTG